MTDEPAKSVPPPGYEGRSLYGGAGAGPGPAGGPPRGAADPLAQRLLRLAGLLAVLLIAVVLNGVLNGKGEELGFNPIAVAAERTQGQPGAEMAIQVTYTAPGLDGEIVATGTGAYDPRSGLSSTMLVMPMPGLGEVTIEAVGDARTVYLHSDLFEPELPPGKKWISFDPWLGNNEAASIASADVKGGLEMLEASGDEYDSLGEETIDGVATSRYRSTIELADHAEQLRSEGKDEAAELYERVAEEMPGPMTSEVWVDSANLIQRMRMVMETPAPDGGEAMTMDMLMDFTHLDSAPEIELPPRDEVFDATSIARSQLGLPAESAQDRHSNDTNPGTARPDAASAAPSSAASFRRRANAVCRRTFAAAKPTMARVEELNEEIERRAPELKRMDLATAGREMDEFIAEFARVMEPLYPLMSELEEELRKLRPPAAAAPRYDRLLGIHSRESELFLSMTRAMRASDRATYDRLEDDSDGLDERSDRLARSLGLTDCVSEETGTD